MSKLRVLAVTFLLLCPLSLFADQIVLKNGDRLTGTIEKSDDKSLVIKSEFAGEVTVQWDAVQEINSTQPSARQPEQWSDRGGNRDHVGRQPGGGDNQQRDRNRTEGVSYEVNGRSRAGCL